MSPVSRLLYPVFCLLSPASCLMSPESNILSHFSHLMSQVSNLLSQVSCLLSPISYLLSPVSRLLSQGSCLKYPFSCLMCPALCPTMLNCFKQKQITCTRNAISRIYIRFPFKFGSEMAWLCNILFSCHCQFTTFFTFAPPRHEPPFLVRVSGAKSGHALPYSTVISNLQTRASDTV